MHIKSLKIVPNYASNYSIIGSKEVIFMWAGINDSESEWSYGKNINN